MLKLYEIAEAYNQIVGLMDEDGGWEQALNDIEDMLDNKVESIAMLIKSLEAEGKAYQEEAMRLSDKVKVAGNKVKSLKDYLLAQMALAQKDKVKGKLLSILRRQSPPACEILNEEEIPQDYKKLIPEQWLVDKRLIIDAWKEDMIIPGAKVSQGEYIQIK